MVVVIIWHTVLLLLVLLFVMLTVVYGVREANFDDACTRARSVHVNWYGAQSPSFCFYSRKYHDSHIDNMTTWALYYTVRTF